MLGGGSGGKTLRSPQDNGKVDIRGDFDSGVKLHGMRAKYEGKMGPQGTQSTSAAIII